MASFRPRIQVEMLPAGHGDALLVRYQAAEGKAGRILIDGGPSHVYPGILARITGLPLEERHFELLVITHIDGDHIDGIIRLLQEDLPSLGVTFDDVWFNGTRQLDQVVSPDDALGARQGEYLQALIEHLDLPWNRTFEGGPVVARPDKPVTLPAGGVIRVLSPTKARLAALLEDWNKIMKAEGFPTGSQDDVLARLRKDKRLRALGPEPDALGDEDGERAHKGPDRTLANGSSIAFTLEVGPRKVLFTGDAHADALLEALDAYLKPGKQLEVDAIKMPHHGSSGNWSAALLDRLQTRHFLFSSDGKYFQHPDALTIETILGGVDKPELWFNYVTPQTVRWLDPEVGEDAILHYPTGGTYP